VFFHAILASRAEENRFFSPVLHYCCRFDVRRAENVNAPRAGAAFPDLRRAGLIAQVAVSLKKAT
jgi:hypothetical protein